MRNLFLTLGVAAALAWPAAAQGTGETLRLHGVTVLTLRVPAGGFGVSTRIAHLQRRASAILSHPELEPLDVEVEVGPDERTATVWVGRQLFVTATEADARSHDTTPERLARQWAGNFRRAFERSRDDETARR